MHKIIAASVIAASAIGFGGQSAEAASHRVPVGKVHTVKVDTPCSKTPTRRGVYVRPCYDRGGYAINIDGRGTFVETDRPINRKITKRSPLVVRWNTRYPNAAEVWHGRTLLADDAYIYN